MASSKASRVTDVGEQCSTCGYCGSSADTSISHGMLASTLSVEDYQDLIDLGWRRSGTYLYKPQHDRTCCPPYTIRMWANRFQPIKDQAKRLRKLATYLAGHQPPTDQSTPPPQPPAAHLPTSSNTSRASSVAGTKRGRQHQDSSKQPCVLREVLTLTLQHAVQVMQAGGSLPQDVELPAVMLVPTSGSQQHSKKHKHKLTQGTGQPAQPSPTAASNVCAPHQHQPVAPNETQRLHLSSPSCLAISAAIKRAPSSQQAQVQGSPASPADTQPPASQASDISPPALAVCLKDCLVALLSAVCAQLGSSPASTPAPSAHLASPAFQQAVSAVTTWLQHRSRPDNSAMDSDDAGSGAPGLPAALLDVVGSLSKVEITTTGAYINLSLPQLPCASQSLPLINAVATATLPAERMEVSEAGSSQAGGSDKLEVTIQPSQFNQEEFELYRRYQVAQHGDEEDEVTVNQYTHFLVDSPLQHVPPPAAAQQPASKPTKNKDNRKAAPDQPSAAASHPASAPAADAVQDGLVVVTPEAALASVTAARASSGQGPDSEAEATKQAPPCGYGSFHMQYRWNGKLVAVGVVDVLPRCLSGVYLFWDPALRHLGLGKLSALFEILWVQQASKVCPGLQWYYMGFYIPTCHKMRYKAEYTPSDLVCPATKTWVRLSPQVQEAVLQDPKLLSLATLPACTVYCNLAHSQQETAAVAARLGLQLDRQSGALVRSGQPGADGASADQTSAPAAVKGEASKADNMLVHLWNKTSKWQVHKQWLEDEAVKMVQQQMEAWMQVVGSVLSERLVYRL